MKTKAESKKGWRQLYLPWILLTLGGTLLLLAQSAFWVNHTLFDKETFTNTVSTTLTSESSRESISSAVVDKVLADRPVLKRTIGDRVEAFVSGILGSDLSVQAINTVVEKTYSYATSANREDVGFDLTAVKTPVAAVVAFAEQQGREVTFDPNTIPDEVVLIESDEFPDFSGVAKSMLWIAPLLWLGTLLSFGFYIYGGRSQYAKRVYFAGLAIILVSIVGLLLGPFLPPPLAAQVQNINLRPLVNDLVTAFLQPFLAQMYKMLGLALLVLLIFNQRFNILSLIRKIEQKLQSGFRKK
jgi:hypothetical protein